MSVPLTDAMWVSILADGSPIQRGTQVGIWYGMVWYGMVWYGMVWCGMVWCGVSAPAL